MISTPTVIPRTNDRRRWVILALLLAAEAMDVLDTTAVTVAGPVLARDLDANGSTLQWIVGGYALAIGAGLVLGGRLGDRFGRRRIFLIGITAFVLTSLACALAPDAVTLLVLRLMQGAAGALILPQSYGIVRAVFPRTQWAAAFGVIGPVMSLASVAGPIVGGALIDADLFGTSWRAIFLINVPIGAAVLLVGLRLLPRDTGDRAARIEVPGAVLLVAACVLLVLPLVQGEHGAWNEGSVACLFVSLAIFVMFGFSQRRAARRGRGFLVAPTLLRKPVFLVGIAGTLMFFACQVGTQFALTLHLQSREGFTAGMAGLASIPLAVGIAIGAAFSGAVLASRTGRAGLQGGATVQILGTALMLGAIAWWPGYWSLVPGLVLAGIGCGIVLALLFDLVVSSFDTGEVGSGSGMLSAGQSIGMAIGIGVFGSVVLQAPTDDSSGLGSALTLVIGMLTVFLLLTVALPRRMRPVDPR